MALPEQVFIKIEVEEYPAHQLQDDHQILPNVEIKKEIEEVPPIEGNPDYIMNSIGDSFPFEQHLGIRHVQQDTLETNTNTSNRNLEESNISLVEPLIEMNDLPLSLIDTNRVAKVFLSRLDTTKWIPEMNGTSPSKHLEKGSIFDRELKVKVCRLEDLDLKSLLVEQKVITGFSSDSSTSNEDAEEKLNRLCSNLLSDLKRKKKLQDNKLHTYYGIVTNRRVLRKGCKYCKKVFSINGLLKHQEKCERVIHLTCNVCRVQYKTQERLEEHKASQCDTVNVFGCDICSLKFRFKRLLIEHQTPICRSLRKRVCQICDKAFPSKSNLRSHMQQEHGMGIHLCHICGAITSSDYFSKHLRSHAEKKNTFVCGKCGKCFKSNREKYLHNRDEHLEKVLKCAECGLKFCDKRTLKKHMGTHGMLTHSKYFKCKLCGKLVVSARKFKHLRKHANETSNDLKDSTNTLKPMNTTMQQLDCAICEKSFSDRSKLKIHLQIHSGEKPYSCKECGKQFRKFIYLKQHGISHNPKPQYSCSYCNKSFCSSYKLKCHVRIHTGEKPYSCKECGKHFRTSTALRLHEVYHNPTRPYSCSYCSRSFPTSTSLKNHITLHTGEKPYSCKECGKQFRTSRALRKHAIIHNPNHPYSCSHCGMSFHTSFTLKSHLMIHMGEKPYVCKTCGKHFSTSRGLRRHQVNHNPNNPFPCSYCSRSFPTPYTLKIHLMIHTGEKPFSCKECHKSFRTTKEMSRHKYIHIGKPFVCGICEKSYIKRDIFEKHLLTHTNVDQESNRWIKSEPTEDQKQTNLNDSVFSSKSIKEEKPHICPKCEIAFNNKVDLDMHIFCSHTISECVSSEVLSQSLENNVLSTLNINNNNLSLIEKSEYLEDSKVGLSNLGEKFFINDNSMKMQVLEHLDDYSNSNCNKNYLCNKCGVSFPNNHIMNQHLCTHEHKANPYSCKDFVDKFRPNSEHKAHTCNDNSNQNYSCTQCAMSFNKSHLLKVHTNQKHGNKPPSLHPCPHCGKSFVRADRLKVHIRLHTGEKPFACSECDKSFRSASQLKFHNYSHIGKPHSCGICRKTFIRKSRFNEHLLTHENTDSQESKIVLSLSKEENFEQPEDGVLTSMSWNEGKSYMCLKCKIPFNNMDDLNSHTSEIHQCTQSSSSKDGKKMVDGVKSFNISFSDVKLVSYGNSVALEEDAEMPSDNVNNLIFKGSPKISNDLLKCKPCPEFNKCNENFPTDKKCQEDLATHENKPYLCQVCGTAFMCGNKYNKHMISHLYPNLTVSRDEHFVTKPAENPFACTTCNKVCTTLHHLKLHSKKHSQLIDSPKCEKKFGNRYKLKSHLAVHSNDSLHECSFCGATFKVIFSRNRHEKTCKKNNNSLRKFNNNAKLDSSSTETQSSENDETVPLRVVSPSQSSVNLNNDDVIPAKSPEEDILEMDTPVLEYPNYSKKHSQLIDSPKCEKKVANRYKLKSHLAVHSNVRLHECSFCGATFKVLFSRNRHEKTCKNNNNSLRKFNNNGKLVSSSTETQSSENDETVPLRVVSPSQSSVNLNNDDVIPARSPEEDILEMDTPVLEYPNYSKKHSQLIDCPKCEKKVANRYKLKSHLTVHSNDRPHECSFCGATFKVLFTRNRHEKTCKKNNNSLRKFNNDAKPVSSSTETQSSENNETVPLRVVSPSHSIVNLNHDVIPARSPEEDILEMDTPVLEYPNYSKKHSQLIDCPKCEKKVANRYKLKSHLAVHSNDRPHECSFCGATFKVLFTRNRHEKTCKKNNNSLRKFNNDVKRVSSSTETQSSENDETVPLRVVSPSQSSVNLNDNVIPARSPEEDILEMDTPVLEYPNWFPYPINQCLITETGDVQATDILCTALMSDQKEKIVRIEDW